MQVARSPRKNGALEEATLDALAADLTVPHSRPLVDLDRDDYADLEVGEPATTRYERVEVAPPPPVAVRSRPSTQRVRKRQGWWTSPRVAAALATTAIGFGVGAGIALLVL